MQDLRARQQGHAHLLQMQMPVRTWCVLVCLKTSARRQLISRGEGLQLHQCQANRACAVCFWRPGRYEVKVSESSDACSGSTTSKIGRPRRSQAGGSVAHPAGDFHSDGGSEKQNQLNAFRETLEQLEDGTPNVIDV